MAYPRFTENKPVISPDTGGQVIQYTRENLHALRDAIVGGALYGWAMQASMLVGGEDQPSNLTWSKDVYRISCAITWGTSGNEQYQPKYLDYTWSGNSGATWDEIGRLTLTFTTGGNVVSSVWGDIP
jgi:hypothetical protein